MDDEMPDTEFTRAITSANDDADADRIIHDTLKNPPDPESHLFALLMLKLRFDVRGGEIKANAELQQTYAEMMETALEFALQADIGELIGDFASRLSVLVAASFGSNKRKRLEKSIRLGQLILSRADSIPDVDLLRYTARNVSNSLGHLFDELERESASDLGQMRADIEGADITPDPDLLHQSLDLAEFAVGLCTADTHPMDRAYALAARGAAQARMASDDRLSHYDLAQADLTEARAIALQLPGEQEFVCKMDIDIARLLVDWAEANGEGSECFRSTADDQLRTVIGAANVAQRWRAEAAGVRVRIARHGGDSQSVASLMLEQMELTPQEVNPDGARALAADLAELTLSINPSAWLAAARHYSVAAEITDMYLYGVGNDFAEPQSMLDEYRLVNRNAAYCYCKAGEFEKAIEIFEAGKCRTSGVLQRRTDEQVARVALDRPDLADSFRAAHDMLRLATEEQREDLPVLRREFAKSVRRVRSAGYRIFEPADYADIASRAGDRAPIIFMISTPRGAVSLICKGLGPPVASVWADGMTGRKVSELALGFDAQTGGRTLSVAAWQDPDEIARAVPSVIDAVRNELITPLANALASGVAPKEVLLVTSGNLGALPLHAAGLSDIAPVKHLPASAFILGGHELRNREQIARGFYGLGDPPSPPLPRLPGAEAELRALTASRSGTCHLALGETATVGFLQEALQNAADLHIACHAEWSSDEHRGPVLLLADGQVSYVAIASMRRNPKIGLVVAAGCSTGVLDTLTSQDESVTLATAFLSMGATGVITALWPVDDRASALLFWRFSALWNASDWAPAAALADAAVWLRELDDAEARRLHRLLLPDDLAPPSSREETPDSRPYSHPFYWAPFVYSGS